MKDDSSLIVVIGSRLVLKRMIERMIDTGGMSLRTLRKVAVMMKIHGRTAERLAEEIVPSDDDKVITRFWGMRPNSRRHDTLLKHAKWLVRQKVVNEIDFEYWLKTMPERTVRPGIVRLDQVEVTGDVSYGAEGLLLLLGGGAMTLPEFKEAARYLGLDIRFDEDFYMRRHLVHSTRAMYSIVQLHRLMVSGFSRAEGKSIENKSMDTLELIKQHIKNPG